MASKYQKRHYEDVAKVIVYHGPDGEEEREDLACAFVDLFTGDNPLFDRERFLKACGLEDA